MRRTHTIIVKREALAMLATGLSAAEVARRMNIRASTVRMWAIRAGLPPMNVTRLTTEQRDALHAALADRWTDEAISAAHGWPVMLIAHARKRGLGDKPYRDLAGQQFGHWLVLHRAFVHGMRDRQYWLCECRACSKTYTVPATRLACGRSKSCAGCKNRLSGQRRRAGKTLEQRMLQWERRRKAHCERTQRYTERSRQLRVQAKEADCG